MLQVGTPVIYIGKLHPFVLCVWSSVRFIFRLLYFDTSHELVLLFSSHFHHLVALESILFDASVDYC